MVSSDPGEYDRRRHRSRVYLAAMAALIVVTFFYSLRAASVELGLVESWKIFVDHINGFEPSDFEEFLKDKVVFEQNGPRALVAICVGMTLSIGGAVMQSLIRNPLADPYTLGISSGALFGMVLYVGLGISVVPFISSDSAMIVNAFLLSLVPTIVIIVLSTFKKVSPTMMILCGIAVMYIFSAFTTIIKYNVDEDTLGMIYQWSVGSVYGQSWGGSWKVLLGTIFALVCMMCLASRIDIVAQGDLFAHSLGICPNRMRIVSLVIISVSTAVCVCYTGTIGFVGLIAPHVARIFVGSRSAILIPSSACIGALMVLSGDVLVRLFMPSIPVGAILALFCSPIFIFILSKMRKGLW